MKNLRSNNYPNSLRLRIIKLYNDNKYSVLQLAKLFSVGKSSIYNWIKLFKNNDLVDKQPYIKTTSVLRNEDIKQFVNKYIDNNPNFDYKTLTELIKTAFDVNIEKSTLYNIIRNLGLTKKRIKTKKIYGCQDKLNEKKKALQNSVKNIDLDNIISIDEVSFDTNIIHNYAWSLKNTPIVKSVGATYKRLTMICAVSNSEVIHYEIVNNSADKNIFLQFIKSIPNKNGKILFLDNARIHHAKIVKEYIEKNNIKMLFNVAYSPQFNPIELMFSKLKKLVKDCITNNDLSVLKTNIINSLKHITKNNLNKFFTHSFDILLNSKF